MRQQNFKSMRRQSGFTMTELLIVVVIIGILGVVTMRALSGSTDGAQAIAIRSTASELAKGMGYIHANLGNGLDPTAGNVVAGGSGGMLAVLVEGEGAVHSDYKQKYVRLGMRPLSSEITKVASNYRIYSHNINMVPCAGSWAGRKVCTTFTNISTPVAEALADKEGLTLLSSEPGKENAQNTNRLQDTLHLESTGGGMYTATFALVP